MNIHEQLSAMMDEASFTIADMAVWYEQNQSTMQKWITCGAAPHRVKHRHLTERTHLLKKVLSGTRKLPVPNTINQYERKAYIESVRDYAVGRFLKAGTSGRRA